MLDDDPRTSTGSSDVVHAAAGLLGLTTRDLGDRGPAEDLAEGADTLGPDSAGLVSFLADLFVERLDHFEDVDLIGGSGQRIAALHPAMGDQQAVAAQC